MNDKDLTLRVLEEAFQEARRDDLTFSERGAVYSLVRTLATDIEEHIDDNMDGHGYAHEQVTKIVWHIGAMLGFDITNGHDKDMHASWAIGAMGGLKNVFDEHS
ncbi:MAG: hypothetical protein MK010_07635 [Erythrobacter sp.]|nr:hypothetical protein [Erythrobacter sp.]